MVDPPTYRADPDPEFADRLERVLLQRLTADPDAVSSGREVVRGDEQIRPDADHDNQGELIMLDTDDRSTSQVAPRRRSPGRWALVAAAVAAVAIVGSMLVAVGGDDEKPLDTVTVPTTAPNDTGCPLTAEEVSEVIGETITGPKSATECHFGRTFPSVVFDYLTPFACTPEGRSTADGGPYVDAVDGLGVDAYAKGLGIGRSLLVCNGDRRPFSVFVEGTEGDPLATAVALARLVLDD